MAWSSEKDVSPGEWVAPGKPLFTLVDDDPLKIELSVPEKAVTDDQARPAGHGHRGRAPRQDLRRDDHAARRGDRQDAARSWSRRCSTRAPAWSRACSPRRTDTGESSHVVLPSTAVEQRGEDVARVRRRQRRSPRIASSSSGPRPPRTRSRSVQGVVKGEKVIATAHQGRASTARKVAGVSAMQWLASICVRRPVFATVLILVFVVVGMVGYSTPRRRQVPEGRLPARSRS